MLGSDEAVCTSEEEKDFLLLFYLHFGPDALLLLVGANLFGHQFVLANEEADDPDGVGGGWSKIGSKSESKTRRKLTK